MIHFTIARALKSRVLRLACTSALFVSTYSIISPAQVIPIYPITTVDTVNHLGYFSDPYHVPYTPNQGIYIAGTTQGYLQCGTALEPQCAGSTLGANTYTSGQALLNQASGNADICSAAGIHPHQNNDGSWDAVVTLHVQPVGTCSQGSGISGWSVIVHAHPNTSGSTVPPGAWTGDSLLIGSFSTPVDANYDGKYFQTPNNELYLVYSKELSSTPHRDGVVARLMSDPETLAAGSSDVVLLAPDDIYNSEDYTAGDDSFKLIETGNIRAYNGKFIMAYSVGAFDHNSYKLGVAYSDTFIPANGGQYRKVTKANPNALWGTSGREVYYLLQADQNVSGWHYVGDSVLAPGVPTVASIGPNNAWVLTFAGYDPNDAPRVQGTSKYVANHRRPYFININMAVPSTGTVAAASDDELQNWITPVHQ